MYVVLDSRWKEKSRHTTLKEINTQYNLDFKREDVDSLVVKKGKRIVREEGLLELLPLLYQTIETSIIEKVSSDYLSLQNNLTDLQVSVSNALGILKSESVAEEVQLDEQELQEIQEPIKEPSKNTTQKVDFVKILKDGALGSLAEMKGKSMLSIKTVAVLSMLEEHEVQYLVHTVLKSMGSVPTYENRKVISPSEALWVLISARAKRDGFSSVDNLLQKASLNGRDFYGSWLEQKEELDILLK